MTHLLFRCYAKINLTLEVVRKRADGFHDLASLVHTISLADDLRIEMADDLLARVEGLDIEPQANLVMAAARLLASRTGEPRGAELTLQKRIPAAAGLGGGSSDAATALVGLNALWDTRLKAAELRGLAAQLGSDVPFFVRGGAALMTGRGDVLRVLPPLNGQWLVLLVPRHAVTDKTARLYSALEPADFSSGQMTALAADRVGQRQAVLEPHLTNAFTRAARSVFDGLAETWAQAEQVCGCRFFLSGAGPALFALARDRAQARQHQAKLLGLGLPAYTARTVRHARASVRVAAEASIRYP